MMTVRKKYILKRLAAATLAVLLSVSVFGAYGQDKGVLRINTSINGAAVADDPKAEYERQMAELDQKKKELDQKIAAAGSDIKGQQEKLDAVNEKAETIKKKIEKITKMTAELEDEMAMLDSEMRDTQYNLEQSEEQIGTDIGEFKERLRAMYVAGNESYSEVLVNANSFYDVLMRVELVKRVAKHDNDTIDALLEQKSKIEKYQSELDEQSTSLKAKSAEYGKKQKQLADQQAELLRLQNEYGTSIEALSGDLSGYLQMSGDISNQYAALAEKARTATTTTTTMTSTEPETEAPEEEDGSSGTTDGNKKKKKAKTTKKESSPEVSEPDVPEETTSATTKAPETEAPRSTTEAPVTTEAPATTSKAKTKKTTTASPATTEPEDDMDVEYEDSDRETKVNIVVNYAKGMVGGSYVWAGERYGATDCSGLVMLSYRQVGINLPHYAASQANYGSSVSYNDLMPGDLVFFGGSSYSSIYHVAMYIGDGKIVHAESTATGIVISYLSSVAKYNNITCMKRLL
ncbi:MAG: C40 family peptidase [Ruminococcus sp.]|nr:C40 family peptidase [Ruminococcus sp.]